MNCACQTCRLVVAATTEIALTILIAESKPPEMDVVKNIVITVLNRKNGCIL